MIVVRVLLALMFAGCATACGASAKEKWTDVDTTGAQDQANAALSLEEICARGDAGVCPAAFVRSVQIGEYCNATSMLYRHGQTMPEAGTRPVNCQR